MTDAIKITNLSYSYTTQWLYRKIPALEDLNLSVRQGEFFGFLGNNGGGKTTTIKCILRLLQPSTGTILINGKSNQDASARRSVGYLAEQPYFYDHLSVGEVMQMSANLAQIDSDKTGRMIDEKLEMLGVQSRKKSPMRSLSKGLTQRVAMAAAIVSDPEVLILDEPFSGLDPLGRKEFRDVLFELKKKGTTIFICTHIINDIERLCDRASIIVKGELKGVFDLGAAGLSVSDKYELVVSGSQPEADLMGGVCSSYTVKENFVHLICEGEKQSENLLRTAIDKGCRIESFNKIHSSLEDTFVELAAGAK